MYMIDRHYRSAGPSTTRLSIECESYRKQFGVELFEFIIQSCERIVLQLEQESRQFLRRESRIKKCLFQLRSELEMVRS